MSHTSRNEYKGLSTTGVTAARSEYEGLSMTGVATDMSVSVKHQIVRKLKQRTNIFN